MDLWQSINKDIVHYTLQFLQFKEVYFVSRHINKYFNDCTKSLKYGKITFNTTSLTKLLEMTRTMSKTMNNTFKIPDSIIFSQVVFTPDLWGFVKTFKAKKIHYYSCDMNNDIIVPKNVTHFSVHCCAHFNVNNIISEIVREKQTLIQLHIVSSCYLKSSTIRTIFSLKLHELNLNSGFFKEDRGIITSSHLKTINFDNLRELRLTNFHFDSSVECLKNNNLKYLCLDWCSIDPICILNMISPSLLHLSVRSVNVDDSFIEQLLTHKERKLTNMTRLDLTQTDISEKCFKHLNMLELVDLNISKCWSIRNLVGLKSDRLEKLWAYDNDFCDDDIKYILQENVNLTALNIEQNTKVTDETLRIMAELSKTKSRLETLYIEKTSVTKDGILKYLSGMNLQHLSVLT